MLNKIIGKDNLRLIKPFVAMNMKILVEKQNSFRSNLAQFSCKETDDNRSTIDVKMLNEEIQVKEQVVQPPQEPQPITRGVLEKRTEELIQTNLIMLQCLTSLLKFKDRDETTQ